MMKALVARKGYVPRYPFSEVFDIAEEGFDTAMMKMRMIDWIWLNEGVASERVR